MIQQAVILAAGNGSRIQRSEEDVPKPLRKLCGLTLLKRNILNAKLAGINEFLIVVGYKGDQIVDAIESDSSLSNLKIRFIHNEDWKKSNGVSLLRAKNFIADAFLLMMADHVFDFKALQKMIEQPLPSQGLLLGVDKKLDEIFDLDDVTKVNLQDEKILNIGKNISDYNAFDTGLFACTRSLVDVLQKIYDEKSDASITAGVLSLASEHKAFTCDLSGYLWHDVDTPAALKHAQQSLYATLRKPTDGWISRNINRRISITLTRALLHTNLSANHVTGLVCFIGILSGFFVAKGTHFFIALGGIIFNLASIVDGCDGEISKLKLTNSKTGEWLDTLSDNATYVAFLIGTAFGTYHQNPSTWIAVESVFMLLGILITLSMMFFYLIRYTNSGSLVTVQKELDPETSGPKKPETGIKRILSQFIKIKFFMKRDFFAVLFMVLTLINELPWILHLTFLGANITWMVFLAYKREIFKFSDDKVSSEILEPTQV